MTALSLESKLLCTRDDKARTSHVTNRNVTATDNLNTSPKKYHTYTNAPTYS